MKVMSTIIAIGLLAAAGAAGKSERVFEAAPTAVGDVSVTSSEASSQASAEKEQAITEWHYTPAVPYVAPKVPI